ncbi:MAG: rhamnulokinase [Candidatus Sabulitectum sp.]|nr:rhamnulokinase [Candidatus Sabulitectum sp.]
MKYSCLALDLGAGSGRLVLGIFADGKLTLEEVSRFPNNIQHVDGHDRWNPDELAENIKTALSLAKEHETEPLSIGVDTWGVDYVLLDHSGKPVEQPVAYRDKRTEGRIEKFTELISKQLLFQKTGINFHRYNTLYQLSAQIEENPESIKKTIRLLMMSDYFNYLLSGTCANEFTAASTSQMLNASKRDWDMEILNALKFPSQLVSKPVMPGTHLGEIKPEFRAHNNPVQVIAVGGHDTASAVAAVPATDDNHAFLCTGTWCMMGVEVKVPVCTTTALQKGYSNEGAAGGGFRLLKNLMGLWIIRELQKDIVNQLTYSEMEQAALTAPPCRHLVYPNDPSFFNPASMKKAFNQFFQKTRQAHPVTDAEYISCAYHSLALLYREALDELRSIHKNPIECIHLLGGACHSPLMCQLTASATGLPVYAGPAEGSVTGNLIVQAIALGKIKNLRAGRELIRRSFDIAVYHPEDQQEWQKTIDRFNKKISPQGKNNE